MSLPFTMSVPLDARYRSLAPAVAGKYAELLGAAPADAEGLMAALTKTLDGLAGSAGADAHADLVFHRAVDGVQIDVHCAGRSTVLKHLLPATRR